MAGRGRNCRHPLGRHRCWRDVPSQLTAPVLWLAVLVLGVSSLRCRLPVVDRCHSVLYWDSASNTARRRANFHAPISPLLFIIWLFTNIQDGASLLPGRVRSERNERRRKSNTTRASTITENITYERFQHYILLPWTRIHGSTLQP